MHVFAFDRDGTTDTSNGPVPIALIKRLMAEGHLCLATGNQTLLNEVRGLASGMLCDHEVYDKTHALVKIRALYVGYERYIVVDDAPLNVPGWEYFAPAQFVASFS